MNKEIANGTENTTIIFKYNPKARDGSTKIKQEYVQKTT